MSRQVHQLSGFEVSVVTPEDLILSKLVWASDSHPELDIAYLEKWAPQLEVLPKLDELRP